MLNIKRSLICILIANYFAGKSSSIDLFPVANIMRTKFISLYAKHIWFNDIYVKQPGVYRKVFSNSYEDSQESVTLIAAMNVYGFRFDIDLNFEYTDSKIDDSSVNGLLNYASDLSNCARYVDKHDYHLQRLYNNCPSRCNARPCLFVENAFEDSCEWDFLNTSMKYTFFEYTAAHKKMLTELYPEHVRNAFERMLQTSFRCECHHDYVWVADDSNNSGGVCVRKISTPNCDTIKCVTGKCVENNGKSPKCIYS